jgi:hypothetical protein
MRLSSLTILVLVSGYLALLLINSLPAPYLPRDDQPEPWLRGPLSDDAYYYLTVARNIGRGLGSTLHGEAVTGYQPLFMSVALGAGWLSDWDINRTPRNLVTLCFLLQNVVGLMLVVAVARQSAEPGLRNAVSFVAAILWLCHSFLQRFSLLGLETSLALVAWLVCFLVLVRFERLVKPTLGAAFLTGSVLGLAFLARNDLVVLPAAFGIVYLLARTRSDSPGGSTRAIGTLAVMAIGFIMVASPWLLFNLVKTGHWVPQSGLAEGLGEGLRLPRTSMLNAAPGALIDNLVPISLPLSWLSPPARMVIWAIVVLTAGALLWTGYSTVSSDAMRRVLAAGLLAYAGMTIIYVGGFSAPWMLQRWLAPGALFAVLLSAFALGGWWVKGSRLARAAVIVILLAAVTSRLGTALRDRSTRFPTNTYPTVTCLRSLGQFAKAGIIQSGLPGWVDERVYNLDGKVSLKALHARMEGRWADYTLEQDFDVIAEYGRGMADLERDPRFEARYVLKNQPEGLVTLIKRR